MTLEVGACFPERIYLPATQNYGPEKYEGVSVDEGLESYIRREFPQPTTSSPCSCFSIPRVFVPQGKAQASRAERYAHERLCGVGAPVLCPLWQVVFQGAVYAGHSNRNARAGKLMTREHDFVVFNMYQGKYFVTLIEVKSTCDDTTSENIISNPSGIKNNKRSGLHQLRDHQEILEDACCIPKASLNQFLFWPFLTMWTKDPTGQRIRRWQNEENSHVFTDTIADQKLFDEWFYNKVLQGKHIEKIHFDTMFKRFIIMSCGIFVNEIHDGMLALLSQEQVSLMFRKPSVDGAATIVHGAAGTGKTLLVLHKLRQLHQDGLLNERNRALYICYWPGIRADFRQKLEKLQISQYVDTIRFFISQNGFLNNTTTKYRHIFMDECEAICLAFAEDIITNTFENIYKCRLTDPDHEFETMQNNLRNTVDQTDDSGFGYVYKDNEIVKKSVPKAPTDKVYGDVWFLVDINQAALFLPKYSPNLLKHPDIVLAKVMRSTGTIYKVFSQFYKNPIPKASPLAELYLSNLDVGHNIEGPPIYWANCDHEPDTVSNKTLNSMVKVVIDLTSTKGIQPNDLCVIPFLVTDAYVPNVINEAISAYFVADGYRPTAMAHVEEFLSDEVEKNLFLVPWVLRIKGLEFKVVVIAVDQGDFDNMDPEDRRKIYIMASRCTCLLIICWVKFLEWKKQSDVGKIDDGQKESTKKMLKELSIGQS